jgi:hypothetical protein
MVAGMTPTKNPFRLLLLAALACLAMFATSACASTANAISGRSAACWIGSVSGTTTGMTFQWYKNGVLIPGATGVALPPTITLSPGQTIVGNSVFYIATVAATDAGDYTCVCTNNAGSTTSDKATLLITVAPSGAITQSWAN